MSVKHKAETIALLYYGNMSMPGPWSGWWCRPFARASMIQRPHRTCAVGMHCRRYSAMMGPSSMWGQSPAAPSLQTVIISDHAGRTPCKSASMVSQQLTEPILSQPAPYPGLNCQSSENVVGALNPSCQEGRVDSEPCESILRFPRLLQQAGKLWLRFWPNGRSTLTSSPECMRVNSLAANPKPLVPREIGSLESWA